MAQLVDPKKITDSPFVQHRGALHGRIAGADIYERGRWCVWNDVSRMAAAPGVTASDAGLAAFCRAQHRRVVGLLSLYVGDRDLAEELGQETLVRVVAHWSEVAAMDRPEAWVNRVAINLANSSIRRRVAGRRARQRHDSRADVRRESSDDPDTAEVLAVRDAVASLPTRQRTALVLRYYADLPVADVAVAMACSEANVKLLTASAIASLRAKGLEVTE